MKRRKYYFETEGVLLTIELYTWKLMFLGNWEYINTYIHLYRAGNKLLVTILQITPCQQINVTD